MPLCGLPFCCHLVSRVVAAGQVEKCLPSLGGWTTAWDYRRRGDASLCSKRPVKHIVLHHLSLFIGYFWNHVCHRIKTDPEDVDVTSVSSVVATGLIFRASPLLLILFSYSVFFCYELRFRMWKRFQPQCDFPTKSNTFIEPRRRLFIRWKFKKFDFAFIKGRKTSYFRIDKKTIIFKLS